MEQVGSAGIPAGAVFDTMELMNDRNFEDRGIMQVMQHPSYQPIQDASLAGARGWQAAAGEGVTRTWSAHG